MPIPDTESVWQNMQRSETFTFAGAGSDDLFYNCRASAHIFPLTDRGRCVVSAYSLQKEGELFNPESLIVEVKPTPLNHFHTVSLLQLQTD